MEKEQEITNIIIEYKNDVSKMNNLIDFIINFLLDNTEFAGEKVGKRGERSEDGGHNAIQP